MLVNGSNPLLLLDELSGLGDCRIVVHAEATPPLEAIDPTACYFSWEVALETDRPKSDIEDVFIFVASEMALTIEEAPAEAAAAAAAPVAATAGPAEASPAAEAVAPPPPVGEPASGAEAAKRGAKENATIRVAAERLDEMMDRVGELVIAQARLTQLANSGASAKGVAEEIERLTSSLRDAMMGVRMLPIGSLFGRFRRLVHDLSRDLGKEIALIAEGEETELDKTMIERLADPLIHIIRNAADHGLESAEARKAAGKEPVGHIRLVARHAGAEVLISVADDGKGLDAAKIRAKAEEQGLVAPGAVLTEAELHQLLFQPGFSTAKEVSALSGRGVGMDVVRRTIDGLRGSIDVASEPGKGSTFTLRLPLTLAIIEGLLVRVAETCYVVPLTAVEECVELSADADARSRGRSFLNIRGELVPFLRLRELFADAGDPDPHQKVVIVANAETRVGLVVDQIIGSHQIVIKSLSKLHADVPSFSGATILGDGAVALILDVPHLDRLGAGARGAAASQASQGSGGRMMSETQTTSQALMLGLAGEVFAIDARQVREILDPGPVTRVPGAKPYVGKVLNVRGKVIPARRPQAAFRPAAGRGHARLALRRDRDRARRRPHHHRHRRRQSLRGHRARRFDAAADAAGRHALAARIRRRHRQVERRVHRPARYGENLER